MRDAIVSHPRVQLLHPLIRGEAERLIDLAEKGFPPTVAVRVVQGARSFEEQKRLYAQGRTTKGPKVTKAPPGFSFHEYFLAFDYAMLYDKDGNGVYEELSWDVAKDFDKDGLSDWMEVASVFKAAGWIHGADWDNDGLTKADGDKDEHLVDYPHLQYTFGYTVRQLLAKYNNKEFIDGTPYLQLL